MITVLKTISNLQDIVFIIIGKDMRKSFNHLTKDEPN
jgi:hypothetical protein